MILIVIFFFLIFPLLNAVFTKGIEPAEQTARLIKSAPASLHTLGECYRIMHVGLFGQSSRVQVTESLFVPWNATGLLLLKKRSLRNETSCQNRCQKVFYNVQSVCLTKQSLKAWCL